MKAVILAGGLGTRFSEETTIKPKPMIEIGGQPILWHIMKIYSAHDINDFIICLGYKGNVIKNFFANYYLYNSNVTFDLSKNQAEFHSSYSEPWKVTLVDTGEDSLTGRRLQNVAEFLDDEDFCFTYGDGVGDVNIRKLIKYHEKEKRLATVTAASPPGRFGNIEIENGAVSNFQEKSKQTKSWVNAGFFVLSPKVLDYIPQENVMWEGDPLINLTRDNQLAAYQHHGFWQPMDTLPNKMYLEKLWLENKAPWRMWS